YELELDAEGWVRIEQLADALRGPGEWADLTVSDIEEMVASASKRRLEIQDVRIRALYGHSLPMKIAKNPTSPPAVLFHGTSPQAWPQISAAGLLPMGRQYVHLSPDVDMAAAVGSRKTQVPVILRIDGEAAHAAGVTFYEGNDKVWLADAVPPEFITIDS